MRSYPNRASHLSLVYLKRNMNSGRHFLQIPGPTSVPDRIERAMAKPVIDHRGPAFAKLGKALLAEIKPIFGTQGPVVIYPSSGSGAWEAALSNTLSPGDGVLMCETGHFAALWANIANRFGLETKVIDTDWRHPADPEAIESALVEDKARAVKAVCIVHNETATGVLSDIAAIRKAMDAAAHPALLMVDTISSLGSVDFRMDEWGVDVTVAGSQKGLMLPPGLSFNGVSEKALKAAESAQLPKSYWSWSDMLASNETGYFPYTPATSLLYGLQESIRMLNEEGLDNVFARHLRHAEATRAAVTHWGLEIVCADPKQHSPSVTAALTPEGHSANNLRSVILQKYDMSLGTGLGRLADKVFRIGHLGSINDLTLCGALSGVEMGLGQAGVPHESGGVQAALGVLAKA